MLHVIGDVDASNSSQLAAAIEEVVAQQPGPLIVSFLECPNADTSCADVLVQEFEALGTRLLIVAPTQSSVGRVLNRPHLCDLPICDGFREAALAISLSAAGNGRVEARVCS